MKHEIFKRLGLGTTRRRGKAWRVSLGGLGYLSLSIGLAAFSLLLISQMGQRRGGLRRVEFPVGQLCGAAWDSDERLLWIGSCTHGRIQAYATDGTFVRGWFVPASGGGFSFGLHDGVLAVSLVRPRSRVFFDRQGARISIGERQTPSASLDPRGRPEVDTRVLFARTATGRVRISAWESGHPVALVEESWLGWLVGVPFPAGFFVLGGLALVRLASRSLQPPRPERSGGGAALFIVCLSINTAVSVAAAAELGPRELTIGLPQRCDTAARAERN